MESCAGTCDNNATNVDGGINRRALLTGVAGVLGAIGLAGIGDAAEAAAKTYTIGKTTDIPVKSGAMYRVAGKPILVTQPKKGVFRAFVGYCTHQRQELGGMSGNNIACYQHNATFNATTGAVVGGPAPKPLTKVTLTVTGTTLKVKL